MKYLSFILLGFLCLNGLGLSAQCYNTSSDENSWLSCEKTQGPNLERPTGHWIHYDLGETYKLGQIDFWNYNVEGLTNQGIAEIAIDYSDDGINWTAWGTATIAEANGEFLNESSTGPNLENLTTKHLLITVLSTHGNGDCAGFDEIKIAATAPDETAIEVVENTNHLEINITPNPVADVLMATSNQSIDSWNISDINGKILLKGKSNSSQSLEVGIQTLTKGNYLLSVQTKNESTQTVMFNVQ